MVDYESSIREYVKGKSYENQNPLNSEKLYSICLYMYIQYTRHLLNAINLFQNAPTGNFRLHEILYVIGAG